MRIACVGGGPAGLYFAALCQQYRPDDEIVVWERNPADVTFGFGVVFSDETLDSVSHADPVVHRAMAERFVHWTDIDTFYRGQRITSGGHGFAALDRRVLLSVLRERCVDLGVKIHSGLEAPDVDALSADHDLVIAADGVHSGVRTSWAEHFQPEVDHRHCRFMWLGTDMAFDAFKFHIVDTPHGVMQIHGYPYSPQRSTFIVEMHEDVWQRAGFAELAPADPVPGRSDHASIDRCAELFADVLDGHQLLPNNSRWTNFATVRTQRWAHRNVVLLGDAAHTAHFSIGSGTKLAMEDALALVACLRENDTLPEALSSYETERKAVVESTQRAAQASLEWFENIGHYTGQEPLRFAFNLLTRSRRVTYDNLRLRDPAFVAEVDDWFQRAERDDGHPVPDQEPAPPPMFTPFRLRELVLPNRVVVSPMDMYSSVDGTPGEFHLVHLGGKALGGAGLVMTEMVCVSEQGRITPGCAGLYRAEHASAWRRIVDFVHEHTSAKIGAQLGHSGRKGSTRVMWEGIDQPLASGNWPVVAPSPLPYRPGVNQVPRALTIEDLRVIREDFVAAARRADEAGFDLLELHCAHGYLLSGFLSPLTNQRTDAYGGTPQRRLRYPLEVFEAVRAVWPEHKPMTVRISATDWVAGGVTVDDAVGIARAFAEAGVDAVDVSTGQVTPEERPAFGRSYQTPYSDRIRNELGVATIAVGAISSYDDVNSILLAGRADLCAVGRGHLYNPQWTLHAAAEQDYSGPAVSWPRQFRAGSRKPPSSRTDGPKPRLRVD